MSLNSEGMRDDQTEKAPAMFRPLSSLFNETDERSPDGRAL